jgi:hypothetical protein
MKPMAVKKAGNPEKLMLLLFPLITLSLFAAAVIISHMLPLLLGQ